MVPNHNNPYLMPVGITLIVLSILTLLLVVFAPDIQHFCKERNRLRKDRKFVNGLNKELNR